MSVEKRMIDQNMQERKGQDESVSRAHQCLHRENDPPLLSGSQSISPETGKECANDNRGENGQESLSLGIKRGPRQTELKVSGIGEMGILGGVAVIGFMTLLALAMYAIGH